MIGPSWVGDMMMSQSLYRTLQARLSPGDNRRDGTGMVPSIIIADAGVNEAIPMPLGHGALEIGERLKLGHSLREKRYDPRLRLT